MAILTTTDQGLNFTGGSSFIKTGTSTVMSFTTSGNVGIGTTSPSAPLDISSSATGGTTIELDNTSTGGRNWTLYSSGSGNSFGAGKFALYDADAASVRMLVDTSGNVGIGITNPSTKLHVGGIVQITENGETAFYEGNGVRVFGTQNYRFRNTGGGVRAIINVNSTGVTAGNLSLYNASDAITSYINNAGSSYFNGGNVGIGTTIPSSPLHVVSVNNVLATFESTDANATLYLKDSNTTLSSTFKRITNNLAILESGGNVGIGTTSPAYKLDVAGEGKVTGKFRVGGAVMLAEPGTGVLLFGSEGGAQTAIYSASTERIRINSSGNVGIGTTNPQAKLDVAGNVNIGSTTSSAPTLNLIKSATGIAEIKFLNVSNEKASIQLDAAEDLQIFANTSQKIKLRSGGADTLTLDASQNVGIGTTNPSSKLHVVGHQYVTGQVGQGVAIANKIATYGAEFRTSGASAQIFFGRDGNAVGSGAIGADATYLLRLYKTDNFATPFVIKQTGEVGIGTTSPDEVLEVKGIIKSENTGYTNTGIIINQTSHSDAWRLMQFGGGAFSLNLNGYTSGQSRFQVGTSGDVAIPAGTLTVSGTGDSSIAGNVGIGTTNPATRLYVKETGAANTAIFENSGQTYSFAAIKVAEAQNNKAVLSFAVGDALASTHIFGEINGIVTNNGGALTGDLYFKTNQGDNMQERMRITSAGNVGIGTTSPDNILHVRAADTGYASQVGADTMLILETTNVSNSLQFSSTTSGNQYVMFGDDDPNAGWVAYAHSDNNLNFRTAGAERMRIDASGNVGIGTTSPSANGSKTTLHINSDTNGAAIRLSQASNSSLIRYDNTNGLQVGTIASKNLSFETADTTAITIDTSQNVGIGTTSPNNFGFLETAVQISAGSSSSTTLQQAGLVLSGSSDADDADDFAYLAFTNHQSTLSNGRVAEIRALKNGTNVDTGELAFYTILQERMRIDHNGNVGIGTNGPDSLLHVNGEAQFGATSYQGSMNGGKADLSVDCGGTSEISWLGNYFQVGGTDLNWTMRAYAGVLQTYNQDLFITAGGTGTTNKLRLGTNGQTSTIVCDDGNVGIGTTSPAAKLHIDVATEDNQPAFKVTKVSDNNENAMEVYHGTSSTTRGIADFTNALGSVMYLRGDGNVGIGTNAPAYELDVDGTIHGTSGNFETAITIDGNPVLTGVTDANTYVTSASFNTSNGVLTLTRNDSATVTADLDGKYQDEITYSARLSATLIGSNGNVSNTEYGYLDGVTSAIQTQLNAKQATLTFGIGASNVLRSNGTMSDNEFLKVDGTQIEGRSSAEVKSDLSLNNVENTALSTWAGSSNITTVGTISAGTWQGTAIADGYISSASTWDGKQDEITSSSRLSATLIGANGNVSNTEYGYLNGVTSAIQTQLNAKQATLTFGISDDNAVQIDSASVADNDYAKFTSNGLEGRSFTEIKSDLSLNNVENTALSTWGGSSNITTVGTISAGTWQGTAIADGYISSAGTWNAKQDALTFGIANTNAVKIDSASVADNEYARFTANGLESRSTSEVAGDLGLSSTDSPTFANVTIGQKLIHDGDTNTYLNFATDTISLYTAGSERVMVNSVGNVGIGTSNPQTELHVEGAIKGGFSLSAKSADFTLAASDNGEFINGTSASFDQITISSDLGADFNVGVMNTGANVVIGGTNSMIINGIENGSVTLASGYQPASIVRLTANTYAVFGNLI